MGLVVSSKDIVSIREYCDIYLNLPFSWKGKLTHKRLELYAMEKGKSIPRRVVFDKITRDNILKGDCYLVKDENGQVIAYNNINSLKNLVNVLKQNKVIMEQRREKILEEEGYKQSKYDGIIRLNQDDPSIYEENIETMGSIIVKNNRVKRLLKERRRR